jgi:hypothetical protein
VEQLERLARKGIIDRPVRLLPPPSRSAEPQLPGGRILPPSPKRGSRGRSS